MANVKIYGENGNLFYWRCQSGKGISRKGAAVRKGIFYCQDFQLICTTPLQSFSPIPNP
jgi:hypothetical protein